MSQVLISTLSGFLIILGTLGSVLPLLPGLPLALGGLFLYAISSNQVSVIALVVFSILVLFTIVVDVFAPALAVKGRKASNMGVTGAIVGALVGIFIMGPLGILVGPFVGAFIGEIMHSSNSDHALKVAIASLFGLIISSLFKLIIGTGMFIYYLTTFF